MRRINAIQLNKEVEIRDDGIANEYHIDGTLCDKWEIAIQRFANPEIEFKRSERYLNSAPYRCKCAKCEKCFILNDRN